MIQSISRVCLCIWRGDHERNISDTRHHPETHGPCPHPALVLWPRNCDAAWCAMGNCIGVSWPWCCIQVNSWWIESEEIIWKVPCTIFPNPCLVFSKIKLAAVDWGGKNLGGQVRSDSNYENQCHFLSIHALDQGHRTFIQRIHESLKTKLLSIIICSVWNDGSPRCCNITGVWWPRQSNQRVSSLRDVNSSRCHQFNQFIILSWSSWVSKRVDALDTRKDYLIMNIVKLRQGLARDGSQGKRPQSSKPCQELTLKLVATI